MAERIPPRTLTVLPTPDANFSGSFVPPPTTAAMQPTIGGAVPVSFQPFPVPNVTYMVPQGSVWPGVPGVQGQGAQLPPGGLPLTVGQLPNGGMPQVVLQLPLEGMPPNVVQLAPGGMPPNVVQLAPGGMPPNVVQLAPGGMPPNVVQLAPGGMPTVIGQLPAGGMPLNVGQLPAGGQQLPLVTLPPGDMKPGMPARSAPAHRWEHPLVPGTQQPQQPMGLRPGAVLHGEPPQPAGSCPLQGPDRPGPSTVLRGAPVCPRPTTAPLTCGTAALESGAATTSSDIQEDITDYSDPLTWMNSEAAPKTEVPDDVPDDMPDMDELLTWMNNEAASDTEIPDNIPGMDDLLTWLNTEVASPQEVPQQNQDPADTETEGTEHLNEESLHDELLPELDSQERAELLRWIDATQPPSPAVPSSNKTLPLIAALPDFPWASTGQNGEAWISSDLFCTHPSCSRQLPRPLPCRPFLPSPGTPPELPVPSPLDVPAPPSPCTAHLVQEAQQKQPRVVLTRLALPPGCISCHVPDNHSGDGTQPAECPAPAGTTSGHQQCTGSIQATKRKLPHGQDAPEPKRRR